jgi:GGDEF domain-containing protein
MSDTKPRIAGTGKDALARAAQPSEAVLVVVWSATVCTLLSLLGWGLMLASGPLPASAPAWLALSACVICALLVPAGALRRQRLERQTRQAQCIDADSGAASPGYFEQACLQAQQARQPFGLLVIELSGGLQAGFATGSADEIQALQWAARHALAGTRGSDLVGRLPGLRLAVLLADVSARDQLAVVVNRLSTRLDPSRYAPGARSALRLSIGAAIAAPDLALPLLLEQALRPWRAARAEQPAAIGDNAEHVCPVR